MSNFRRKGNEINRVPFQSDGNYVNYDVTHDELQEVLEDHPQYKDLTDEQRAEITGKASIQTLDSREDETVRAGNGRSLQDSIGEPKEGDLSKSETKTVSDESTGESIGIHENEVNVNDGEPAGSATGTVQDEGTAEDNSSEGPGSTGTGSTTGTKQGSEILSDRGNGTGVSGNSGRNGRSTQQKESDIGKPVQSDSGSNNAQGEEDQNHFKPQKM